jgi:hypothetical protein
MAKIALPGNKRSMVLSSVKEYLLMQNFLQGLFQVPVPQAVDEGV